MQCAPGLGARVEWREWSRGALLLAFAPPPTRAVTLLLPRGGLVGLFGFLLLPTPFSLFLLPPPNPAPFTGLELDLAPPPFPPPPLPPPLMSICLAFNGPVLLSLLLSARVVDVVGSVL